MKRRTLLTALMGTAGAVLSGVVAIPTLLSAVSPALVRRRAAWRPVGRFEEFPIGQIVPAVVQVRRGDGAHSLDRKTVYVWRTTPQEAVVYSRNCTDLSCPVNFDPGSECFFCPCHGGIFAKDGAPMAGPPRVPLFRYANRRRDGKLEIDLYSLPPMT